MSQCTRSSTSSTPSNVKSTISHGRHNTRQEPAAPECWYIVDEGMMAAPVESDDPSHCGYFPPAFRFCRMFPGLPAFRPSDDSLKRLGDAMRDRAPQDAAGDSRIPGGFTYLGQFIDHDVTRDGADGLPTNNVPVDDLVQMRSPSLDLDSLYGPSGACSDMQMTDGVRFDIGMTTPITSSADPVLRRSFPNDLPRCPRNPPTSDREAVIGDDRNDENLAVAQTHLAFLRFHNAVVDQLSADGFPGQLFEEAKRIVTLHYQHIVLFDFLRDHMIDASVFDDIITNGANHFDPPVGYPACMPIEFSVAAYRFGHSMVRQAYDWNRVFSGNRGTLALLFLFTRLSGNLAGLNTLATNWIVDWNRFYEIGGNQPSNVTRKIDPQLSESLHGLPGQPTGLDSLPIRNLLRGSRLGLPSGQDIAQAMGASALTPAELSQGPNAELNQAVLDGGFESATPLWFYILKEAEVKQNGEHLGEVGSRILGEVLVGIARTSSTSIFAADGSIVAPTLPSSTTGSFKMADLLTFIGDLNPLG